MDQHLCKPAKLFFKSAALLCFTLPVLFPGYTSVWAANYLSFGYSLEYGRPPLADTDLDGAPNDQDSDPNDPDFIGSKLGVAAVNDQFTTINLLTEFSDPVVIAGPPSFHDPAPGVISIENITTNSFDAAFEEWVPNLGHAVENFPYLVMETGTHLKPCDTYWDTPCNVIIEVGRFNQTGTTGSIKTVNFDSAPFPGVPHLFLTLQTNNGAEVLEVRGQNVGASSFQSVIYEKESTQGTTAVNEDIGYLAIWSPDGSGEINIGGTYLPYLLQRENIDSQWMPTVSTAIKVEEEESNDAEVDHSAEQLDIFALGHVVFAQDNSSNDVETAGLRQKPPEYAVQMEWGTINNVTDDWTTIPLSKDYIDPVVVAYQGKPADIPNLLDNLGVVRIQNFSGDSFHARFQLWDYLEGGAGAYNGERINYLVAENGNHLLGGGLQVLAGKLVSNKLLEDGEFDIVDISSIFQPIFPIFPGAAPSVFSSVMSFHEPVPRLTRVGGVTTSQFHISQQEQEANIAPGRVRAAETLGWIAIEKGVDIVVDNNGGRTVDVNSVSTDDIGTNYTYRSVVDRKIPVALGHLNTENDIDPATVGQGAIDDIEVFVNVQEEQSADGEITHSTEDLGIIILE